jgi:hypothetical protein
VLARSRKKGIAPATPNIARKKKGMFVLAVYISNFGGGVATRPERDGRVQGCRENGGAKIGNRISRFLSILPHAQGCGLGGAVSHLLGQPSATGSPDEISICQPCHEQFNHLKSTRRRH